MLLDTCVHHKLEHERPFSTSGLIPSFHVFRDVSLVQPSSSRTSGGGPEKGKGTWGGGHVAAGRPSRAIRAQLELRGPLRRPESCAGPRLSSRGCGRLSEQRRRPPERHLLGSKAARCSLPTPPTAAHLPLREGTTALLQAVTSARAKNGAVLLPRHRNSSVGTVTGGLLWGLMPGGVQVRDVVLTCARAAH